MSDETTPGADEPEQPLRRDRQRLRRERGTRASWPRFGGLSSRLFRILPEVIGEIVFAALVALVSYLVYGEVRWLFVAAVWLAVNGVLLLLAAAAVWVRRRRRR